MKIKLRDYQRETIESIKKNWDNNITRNLAVLSTGLGKTIIATKLHEKFQPDKPTMFIVDRIELAHQARESFIETNPSLKVGIEMNKNTLDGDEDVAICSIQSIGRKGSYRIKKIDPDRYHKIIVDEAHVSVSSMYDRVLNYLGVGDKNMTGDKLLLGLTATPNRSDGAPLSKVYDDIVVNYDLGYGVRNGWLTEIDWIRINTNIDISKVKGSKKAFDEKELSEAINVVYRNKLILDSYRSQANEESAICYCIDVEHAYTLADLFNKEGIPSGCIEANTDTQERRELVDQYKKGKIKVLFNYGTLTTGFDAPETSAIILGRPIKSELLYRQIVGRGLRPSRLCFVDAFATAEERKEIIEGSVKPCCKLIDLYDVAGDHDIVSLPTLFGLNKNISKGEQDRFFKEVVQPLEEVKHEHGVDISLIEDLEDLEYIVKKQKLDVKSVNIPAEIKEFTDRPWLPVGDDAYEIVYPDDKKTLLVERDQLDNWDVIEIDTKKDIAKRLNNFKSLSGAFKLADDYASQYYNTDWADKHFKMVEKGVTKPQFNLLRQRLKGGIKVSRAEVYPDTKVPVIFNRNTGNERLDRASASDLIKTVLK